MLQELALQDAGTTTVADFRCTMWSRAVFSTLEELVSRSCNVKREEKRVEKLSKKSLFACFLFFLNLSVLSVLSTRSL